MFIRLACALNAVLVPFAYSQPNACDSVALFRGANQFLVNKEYDKAVTTLDQLRQCPRLSPLESFQIGWLYGRARQFGKALDVFSHIPADIPDRLTHGYAVALSKFELSDYQGAITTLEALRTSGLADTKSLNLLAVSYSKLTLYKQAYEVLSKQIEKDPNDLPTYLNLITVCAEGGDVSKAAEIASQAEIRFPNSPEVLILRGAAQTVLGRSDQAVQDFATAVRLAPDRPDARFFLALMAYNQGKYTEAIATLKQSDQDGLRDSDLHYLMAECLLKVDHANPDAALSELNQALQLNSNSVAAKTLRGRLLLEKGLTKEAVADLEFAHREDPRSRSAIYNLARAYRTLGKNDQAGALFGQLRSETPDTAKEVGDRRLNDALVEKGAQP
jgi:tetratricopeptide (TPR) repeat protein